MKPIFEEERIFLKEYGIDIPQYFWRDGSKIFINANDTIPVITFNVDLINNKIVIKKNFIESVNGNIIHIKGKYRNKKFDDYIINKTFIQEAKESETRISDLIHESVDMTVKYLNNHLDYEYIISISGGRIVA